MTTKKTLRRRSFLKAGAAVAAVAAVSGKAPYGFVRNIAKAPGERHHQGRNPSFAVAAPSRSSRAPCTTPSCWRSRRSTPRAASWARRSSRSIEDPQSLVQVFAEKAKKLLLDDKVAAVLGCYTSASRQSVLPVFEQIQRRAALSDALRSPGMQQELLLYRRGAEPAARRFRALDPQDARPQEILPDRLQLHLSEGDQPRGQGAAAEARRDNVVAEEYAPLGHTEFSTNINKIARSGADIVFSDLVGDSDRRLLQAVPAVRPHRRGHPDLHADHHRAGDRGDGGGERASATTPRSTTSRASTPRRTSRSSSATRPNTARTR